MRYSYIATEYSSVSVFKLVSIGFHCVFHFCLVSSNFKHIDRSCSVL